MTSAFTRLLAGCLVLALFAVPAAPARAEGPSFAVRAGRIMPVSPDHPSVIEDGMILVRNGRIAAIGAGLVVPPDLPLIEMPDATIVPGFVAAASSLAGRHQGDPSVGADFRAIDAFDTYGDYRGVLSSGVTTVHLGPGWHRLVSGRGAVVHLAGGPEERVLRAIADLTVNLGPGAAGPPPIVELTIPPSPDQPINPARPQRPASRMTQLLALQEALRATSSGSFSVHDAALAQAWLSSPVRIQAQADADLVGAIAFLQAQKKSGYLVGGLDVAGSADAIVASGLPLVYTLAPALRSPAGDLGPDPNANERDVRELAQLAGVKQLALAVAEGASVADLRLAAAMAQRAGLSPERTLAAITRIPAEILGVAADVGSLTPGRRANMLVMSGDPLETASQIQRVYVGGRLAYAAPEASALVVRAGTVWLGPGEWLADGEVLIEDGRITEVGRRVARPLNARLLDAGPGSFVTPGLVDAHGHLGLRGDRSAPGPNLSLTRIVGPSDIPEHRVARGGVTSVILAPYSIGGAGAQFTAVKTAGATRDERVVRHTAAVGFTAGSGDAKGIPGRFRSRLEQGKKYVESWKKYETELEAWKKKKAEGKLEEAGPKTETTEEEKVETDPVTGTWSITVTGGPLPEPQTATGSFKLLNGKTIEGRITGLPVPGDIAVTGELDGTTVRGEVDIDTGGMGTPTFEGTIVEEDLVRGTAGIAGMISVDFEMRRTDKKAVEFKVARTRRTAGKDGRPLPPDIDESLEPIRALLEKRIPAVVDVSGRTQIDAVLDVFVDQYELPLILLNGNEARLHVDRMKKAGVGVVLPTEVLRREKNRPYNQGTDLVRQGISVSFQSGAEDGARSLRDLGTFAVAQGLSPEAALGAMTIDAARMYRLDDRIGSIAPGRDGDLVIFSGYPFDAGSAVERVIINGEEVRP